MKNSFKFPEKKHSFSSNIHLIDLPFIESILTDISTDSCKQPILTSNIKTIFTHMFGLILSKLETEDVTVKTRMELDLKGIKFSNQKLVVADMARAGMIPSQLINEMLHTVFDESQIRQDHIYISRTTDTNEQVTGSSIASSKIGGDVDNAVIFIPDPMGATGSSISNVISGYKNDIEGKIKKIICIHLIITPEYIEKLTKDHPDAHVYALRLDDGLDDKQYIMPGAGGIGELLNNSFV